jgi:hypothetical protein
MSEEFDTDAFTQLRQAAFLNETMLFGLCLTGLYFLVLYVHNMMFSNPYVIVRFSHSSSSLFYLSSNSSQVEIVRM